MRVTICSWAARVTRAGPRSLLPLVLAGGLTACLGNGADSADIPEEGPPTETPPPSTPPVAGSEAPTADAGSDRTTVEEQDVTIDGSGSRDPDNDPLTYAWRLRSAPEGSTASVQADTPTFVFRPDLPGTYELQLTVSDGRSESTDTMRVRADPLLTVDNEVEFKLDLRGGKGPGKGDHERDELELQTSRHYGGEPVGFTAAADVSWLRVVDASGTSAPPGQKVDVALEIIEEEAEKLAGGTHEGRVRITPAGGWEEAVALVKLEVERRKSSSLVPYVAYTGEPSSVELYGEGLLEAAGAPVFVNEMPVAHLQVMSDERATIQLPGLQSGVHALRVGEGLALSAESLRLVVRDAPVHSATELELPGVARSLDYSAELDAFYAVFVRADGRRVGQRLQNSGGGEWLIDTIPVDAPWALALTTDGSQLLVSSEGCTVHQLDPRTLARLQSVVKSGCIPDAERFGIIAALGDGRVVAVDDLGDSTSWSYPQLAPMDVVPRLENPPVVNDDRDRLVWSASLLYAVGGAAADRRTFNAPTGAAFDFTRAALSVRVLD